MKYRKMKWCAAAVLMLASALVLSTTACDSNPTGTAPARATGRVAGDISWGAERSFASFTLPNECNENDMSGLWAWRNECGAVFQQIPVPLSDGAHEVKVRISGTISLAGFCGALPTGPFGPLGVPYFFAPGFSGEAYDFYSLLMTFAYFDDGFHFRRIRLQPVGGDSTTVEGALLVDGTSTGTGTLQIMRGQPVPHDHFSCQTVGDVQVQVFVRDEVQQQPQLVVSCSPAGAVARGDTIRCSTSVTPATPFTIVRRTAAGVQPGDSLRLAETPNTSYPAGGKDLWAGLALVSTKVEVFATVSGRADTLSASAEFHVTPRSWAAYRISNTRVDTALDIGGGMRKWVPDGTAIGTWYMYDLLLLSTPVLRANSGPNAGAAVLASRPEFKDGHITHIFLHPAIFTPDADNLYRRWYRQQDGNPPGTCDQHQMLQLRQEELRHEGVTYAPDSHNGVAQAWFDREKWHRYFEELVVVNRSDDVLRERAWDRWTLSGEQMYNDQHAFDQRDYPVIYQVRLQCLLDSGHR